MRAPLLLCLLVAACAPAPPPEPAASRAPAVELPLRLVGTEPFWGARIDAGQIAVSGADRPERRFNTPPLRTGPGGLTYETPGLRVHLTPGACSDGMSDRVYPYVARVELAGETLNGCAIPERLWPGVHR